MGIKINTFLSRMQSVNAFSPCVPSYVITTKIIISENEGDKESFPDYYLAL